MARNECSLALTPHQKILGRHFINRFAYRSLTHTKAHRQFRFTGYDVPWPPLAGLKAARNQSSDLTIQRAEGGRMNGRWRIHGMGFQHIFANPSILLQISYIRYKISQLAIDSMQRSLL